MTTINLTDKVQSRLNDDKLQADIFGCASTPKHGSGGSGAAMSSGSYGIYNAIQIEGETYNIPYRVAKYIQHLESLVSNAAEIFDAIEEKYAKPNTKN